MFSKHAIFLSSLVRFGPFWSFFRPVFLTFLEAFLFEESHHKPTFGSIKQVLSQIRFDDLSTFWRPLRQFKYFSKLARASRVILGHPGSSNRASPQKRLPVMQVLSCSGLFWPDLARGFFSGLFGQPGLPTKKASHSTGFVLERPLLVRSGPGGLFRAFRPTGPPHKKGFP